MKDNPRFCVRLFVSIVSACLMCCGILLHAAQPKAIALTATLSNTTAPPGSTVQLQVFLDSPTPLTTGGAILNLDPTVFGPIVAADVYSVTGDQTGSAAINGTKVDLEFASKTGGIGRSPALPLLTVTVPILSTAKPGATPSITLQPSSTTFLDINGIVYNVSIAAGTLTVGGTASVGNVGIQGGLQTAGSVVEIDGTGFTADTLASIDGIAISNVTVSNAQTIKITLAAPAILDFRRVAVKTPTAPEISFYPVLHGTSQTPVVVQPVFPLQLFEGGVVSSSTGNNGTYYALLNPSAASVNVTEDVSTLAANYSTQTTETQFMLGPGEVKEGTYTNNSFGSTSFTGSAAIRMAQLASAANAGAIQAVPTKVAFSPPPLATVQWTVGTPAPNPQHLTVAGSGPFTVTVTASGGAWLSASPAQATGCPSGSTGCPGSQVTLSIDPTQLSPGTYQATVALSAVAIYPLPVVYSVQLTVLPAHTIQTVPVTLSPVQSSEITTNLGVQTYQIPLTTTDGPAPFSVSYSVPSGQQWLSVNPPSGQAPSTVTISVDGTKLTGTSDTGTVTIQGPANTITVPVTFTVGPAVPPVQFAATSAVFYARTGGPSPPNKMINANILQGLVVSAQTSSGGNWLSVSLTAVGVPIPIVSVNSAGLAAGTYKGTITALSTSSVYPPYTPGTLPVTLIVQEGPLPALSVDTSSVSMSTVFGVDGVSPLIHFSAAGGADIPVNITVNDQPELNWLGIIAYPPSGPLPFELLGQEPFDTPGSLTVNGYTQFTPAGSYSGSITLSAAADPTDSVTIPITFQVVPNTNPAPPAGTVPLVTSMANAASAAPSGISPGEIVTILGQNIGPATLSTADVKVLFDQVPATVLYASKTQINTIVPDSVTNISSVSVVYDEKTIPAGSYVIAGSAPGIFTLNGSGSGAGAVLNQDNSVNSTTSPALRGSVVQIFATGGSASLPTSVMVGGQVATVLFAGQAPGATHGLLQVNAVVPMNVTPGPAVPITISTSGSVSQKNVTIAVQ